jgi:uncharacterized membrane protein
VADHQRRRDAGGEEIGVKNVGIVPMILPFHILAGVLALVFGYVALFAAKGATLHRKSGMLFVLAMVTLSLTGALVAFLNASSISVVAGLLTFYFVTTALRTVRRRLDESHRIDAAAMLFAVTVAILAFKVGLETMNRGRPEAIPMFIFGIVGLLAAAGDLRMIRAGGIHGPRRITRHLWRMCFAMWVAAASFFWGPPGRVPEVIRIPALLPIPVLVPVVVMLYWLWRISIRKTPLGIVGVSTPQLSGLPK